jgi:VanZ family protein
VRLRAFSKSWLPVLAWAALISILSTDMFSSEHTSHFILPVLHWIFRGASNGTLEILHHIIRKCAHLVEYFLLGLLLYRALRGRDHGWQLKWAIWAAAIAAAYASFDEFHQVFVPSRTASPWDALLDTVGACAAQVATWRTWRRRGTVNRNS